MSKYASLRDFLLRDGRSSIKLTFQEIENMIGSSLPRSAYVYRAWWGNDKTHTHARNGQLAAGYIVDFVDLDNKVIVFTKMEYQEDVSLVSGRSMEDHIVQKRDNASTAISSAREFEELARRVMSEYFGVRLEKT